MRTAWIDILSSGAWCARACYVIAALLIQSDRVYTPSTLFACQTMTHLA